METLSTFDLYSLAFTLALFSYILGLVIRGTGSEEREKYLLKTIADNHQCYLTECANLRKDLINEMAVRKTTEQWNNLLGAKVNALQAHLPKPVSGGQSCLEEHIRSNKAVDPLQAEKDESKAVA